LSLPQLTRVSGDITFNDNNVSQLQIDQVELVKGTLTMANNANLVSASFQHLAKIGGAFSIGNNPQLASIDGFPALNEVDGTVDIAGSFDSYALPALQDVRGGMRLQTTSSKLQCDDLELKMKSGNVVKGTTWSCGANMDESQLQPTLGQGGTDDSSTGNRFPGAKGLANENGGKKGTIGGASGENGATSGTAGALAPTMAASWALLLAGGAALFGF
jgi:hypothetical protein